MQQIHFIYSKLLEKKCISTQKWQNFKIPSHVLLERPPLAMNFSPSVSCSEEKEDKDMSSVWHFWKGLILPINQSTWLIDWLIARDQSDWETWNVFLAAMWVHSGPTISIHRCKFGSKLKPFELLCCAQVKTFSIYNFCDFLTWILDVWVKQMRKNSKHFWRQNFTFDRKLAFPPIAPFRR